MMTTMNLETPFYALPRELLLNILTQVADIATLRSAISSCRYLRSVFCGSETLVVQNVLKNFIGVERIHDAVTIESLRLASDSCVPLREYFDIEHCLDLPKWRLQEVHHVKQLHVCVQYFSRSLIAEIKSDDELQKEGFTLQTEPSSAELSRIERSLYQLEALFRYLNSKCDHNEAMESRITYFLSHFCPWENEQLCCAYDHLRRALSQVIDGVCLNDPRWINAMAIADLTPEDGVIQTFLAKGLISAHAAVQAESFERRKEILGSPYDNWSLPTLESGRVPMLYEAEDEESLEAEEFIYRAFWPENDTGPEHAWRWAHQKIGPEEFFPFDSTYSLRKFAYVVWDMDRISALDIFSQPWEPEDPTKLHAARRQRIEQLNQKILDKISKMI